MGTFNFSQARESLQDAMDASFDSALDVRKRLEILSEALGRSINVSTDAQVCPLLLLCLPRMLFLVDFVKNRFAVCCLSLREFVIYSWHRVIAAGRMAHLSQGSSARR